MDFFVVVIFILIGGYLLLNNTYLKYKEITLNPYSFKCEEGEIKNLKVAVGFLSPRTPEQTCKNSCLTNMKGRISVLCVNETPTCFCEATFWHLKIKPLF